MGFYDTKASGPMVVEIPPAGDDGSLNGNFVTLWQTALEDAGLLGVDKGKGVKFLITPPGYAGKIPDGFEQLASDTYGGYFLIRSNLKSHDEADVQKSIAYGKRVKFYPLSAIGNPPETVFLDVKDKDFDSTIKIRFELLHAARSRRPDRTLDRARPGDDRPAPHHRHREGQAFAPDEATKQALEAGIEEAKALLAARYDAGFPPFFEGTRWMTPTLLEAIEGQSTDYADPDKYPVDARGLLTPTATSRSNALAPASITSSTSRTRTARLTTAARPITCTCRRTRRFEQYWSVTAYDRETHALIKGVDRASRASNAADLREERRRLGRRVVRTEGAGRQGIELGPDRPRSPLRAHVPVLCADQGVVRQGVDVAGRGEGARRAEDA